MGQPERLLDRVLHLGAADQLGRRAGPTEAGIEPEEGIGAGVGEEQPAAGVDGDHGLGHRPEHHPQLLAVLLEPIDPALDLGRHRVEHADQAPAPAPTRRSGSAGYVPRPEALEPSSDLPERRIPPQPHPCGRGQHRQTEQDHQDLHPRLREAQRPVPPGRSIDPVSAPFFPGST